jgi:hypothetical protein
MVFGAHMFGLLHTRETCMCGFKRHEIRETRNVGYGTDER